MDRLVEQTASAVASLRRQAAVLHAVAGVPAVWPDRTGPNQSRPIRPVPGLRPHG